jgi:hypothetical protein
MASGYLQSLWDFSKQDAHLGMHNTIFHLWVAFLMVGLFTTWYAICYFLCDRYIKEVRELPFQKKADYSGRIISIIHAIIATLTSIIASCYMW